MVVTESIAVAVVRNHARVGDFGVGDCRSNDFRDRIRLDDLDGGQRSDILNNRSVIGDGNGRSVVDHLGAVGHRRREPDDAPLSANGLALLRHCDCRRAEGDCWQNDLQAISLD